MRIKKHLWCKCVQSSDGIDNSNKLVVTDDVKAHILVLISTCKFIQNMTIH